MTPAERKYAANAASYSGSPEHKLPHARSDATLCPAELIEKQAELTNWLRDAISQGNAGGCMEGKFPRYVWYQYGDRGYEGRLTNRELGEYKGYPIHPDEGPKELRSKDA